MNSLIENPSSIEIISMPVRPASIAAAIEKGAHSGAKIRFMEL
jgi:hypothetical protein